MIHCLSDSRAPGEKPRPIAMLHLAGLPIEDVKLGLEALYSDMLWNRDMGEELGMYRSRYFRVILDRGEHGPHPLEKASRDAGHTRFGPCLGLYPNFSVARAWAVSDSKPGFEYRPPVNIYFVRPAKETAVAGTIARVPEVKESLLGRFSAAARLIDLDRALTEDEKLRD